jgi:membrane protease YdiL (CAAX protease family)
MFRSEHGVPSFDGSPLVPVAAYLLIIAVLSGFSVVAAGHSPPPLLGVAWGVVLTVLGIGAFVVEDIDPRSVLPPARSLVSAVGAVVAFWTLYNLVAYGLAIGGVHGFETAPSRVAGHPVLYLAALGSSLLFTAIPEELVFRGYLQSKFASLAGGGTRRAVAVGVGLTAVLFALFHLPRWFLMLGHGVGPALGTRLVGLTLAGLAYGVVYAATRNLWLVGLAHATMNQPPFLVTVHVPEGLHLLVGLVEYGALVVVVLAAVRLTASEGTASNLQRAPLTSDDD